MIIIIELKINKICWWNIFFLELTKTKEIKNPKKLTKKPDITHKNKELIKAFIKLIFRKYFVFVALNIKLKRIYIIGENKNKEKNRMMI